MMPIATYRIWVDGKRQECTGILVTIPCGIKLILVKLSKSYQIYEYKTGALAGTCKYINCAADKVNELVDRIYEGDITKLISSIDGYVRLYGAMNT
jgi:hypothetical protein